MHQLQLHAGSGRTHQVVILTTCYCMCILFFFFFLFLFLCSVKNSVPIQIDSEVWYFLPYRYRSFLQIITCVYLQYVHAVERHESLRPHFKGMLNFNGKLRMLLKTAD